MAGKRKDSVAPRYRLRVKQRTAIVAYAIEHGVLPASRRFGLDRKTIREWRDRWRQHSTLGLIPRYPEYRPSRVPEDVLRLREHARRDLGYGAPRTRIWLRRVHKRNLPVATIQKAFVRLGLPRLPSSRRRAVRPRQLRLFEKPHPGDSVQIDVKVAKVRGQKVYQYTAIDDCTRFRVLRLYRQQNQRSTLAFFSEINLNHSDGRGRAAVQHDRQRAHVTRSRRLHRCPIQKQLEQPNGADAAGRAAPTNTITTSTNRVAASARARSRRDARSAIRPRGRRGRAGRPADPGARPEARSRSPRWRSRRPSARGRAGPRAPPTEPSEPWPRPVSAQ